MRCVIFIDFVKVGISLERQKMGWCEIPRRHADLKRRILKAEFSLLDLARRKALIVDPKQNGWPTLRSCWQRVYPQWEAKLRSELGLRKAQIAPVACGRLSYDRRTCRKAKRD